MNSFAKKSRACIRRGSKGPDVLFLRQKLADHGLVDDSLPLGVSQIDLLETFDSGLKLLVEKYQERAGFTGEAIDGIVGPNTWEKLGKIGAPCPSRSSSSPSPSSSSGGNGALTQPGYDLSAPFYKKTWFYWTVGGVALAGALALFLLPKRRGK